jgi:hypothetical protein
MALREFRDGRGVEWTVWVTTPDAIHVGTMRGHVLGEYQDGWLTFECAVERKRLAPFPKDWDVLSDAELEHWCEQAKAPRARKAITASSPRADASADGAKAASMSPLDSIAPTRTFTGPSGRLWRVAEHVGVAETAPDASDERIAGTDSATRYFLRFTSELDVLELDTYPMAWARLPDAQLVKLVRMAERVTAPAEPQAPFAGTTDLGARENER